MSDDLHKPTLRKFLIALGMIFPLVGASSADSRLTSDEFVMFLPDIAYEDDKGNILAGVQAWVYEKEKRRGLTHMLALFLGIDMSALTPPQRQQLYARTQLFRVDSERGKELFVRDEAGIVHQMPKTASNGRSQILAPVTLNNRNRKAQLTFQLTNAGTPADADIAVANFAPKTGLSIISDIDDTIKDSSVGDKKQLLINTFLQDFVAVDGMADFYRDMNVDDNVAYHYVSSSPIQLYPVLHDFMVKNGYPLGSMHLREATRWSDIVPLPNASRSHKTKSIERILQAYPNRKFILIGDSSENDPAIYADFKRRYPDRISGIIIRNVTPQKSAEQTNRIFDGLDNKSWIVSSSVQEMRSFMKVLD